jgi:hypothetical protein
MAEGAAIIETVDRRSVRDSSLDFVRVIHSDWSAMAILSREATLNQDGFTVLHHTVWAKCRLKVTGIAGEFSTVLLQTKVRGFITSKPFEGTEVSLKGIQTLPFGEILAKAPAGVGALDITYEVRTHGDA